MATATAPEPVGVIEHPPYEMSTDEFFRMIEAGVFDPRRRIYLWNGRLCEARPKTVNHAALASALNMAISRRLPDGWFVAGENPLALNLKDAPLPEFTVVKGHPLGFLKENRHVVPADVAVVVEVAATGLPRDMEVRRSRYAKAMAATGGTYVVVDAEGHRFWAHEGPAADTNSDGAGAWNKVTQVGPGGSIRLLLRGQALEPIPWEDVMR
jgi:Uma2 family endonuclease